MNTTELTQVHSVGIAQNKQAKGEERSQKTKVTDRVRPDDTV